MQNNVRNILFQGRSYFLANMKGLFGFALEFNQSIGNWDVSSVSDMSHMFSGAYKFNQSIGNWDVSHVEDMSNLFESAYDFNQDLSNWDVSRVKDMQYMFMGTIFNQDIGSWNVSNVQNMEDMFSMTLSTANYNSLLIGWSQLNLQNGVTLNAAGSKYSAGAAATARQYIIDTFGWVITDGGQV